MKIFALGLMLGIAICPATYAAHPAIPAVLHSWLWTGGDSDGIRSVVELASKDEPGQQLIITGVIYGSDGTPLEGVILYAYQTGADGRYNRPGEGDSPRIKGEVKTDSRGRYEIRTVRPGSYPGGRNPAHIHARARGAGYPEQWIKDFNFADDPLIPDAKKEEQLRDGLFSHIMRVERNQDGILKCVRNITLRKR